MFISVDGGLARTKFLKLQEAGVILLVIRDNNDCLNWNITNICCHHTSQDGLSTLAILCS